MVWLKSLLVVDLTLRHQGLIPYRRRPIYVLIMHLFLEEKYLHMSSHVVSFRHMSTHFSLACCVLLGLDAMMAHV